MHKQPGTQQGTYTHDDGNWSRKGASETGRLGVGRRDSLIFKVLLLGKVRQSDQAGNVIPSGCARNVEAARTEVDESEADDVFTVGQAKDSNGNSAQAVHKGV